MLRPREECLQVGSLTLLLPCSANGPSTDPHAMTDGLTTISFDVPDSTLSSNFRHINEHCIFELGNLWQLWPIREVSKLGMDPL